MNEDSSTPKRRRSEAELLDAVLAKALRPRKLSPDFDARLDALIAKAAAEEAARKRTGGESRRRWWSASPQFVVSGSAVVLVGLGAIEPHVQRLLTGLSARTTSEVMIVTRVGGRRSIEVGDRSGSTIVVNTNSIMGLWTNGQTYHVEVLKGEVLFDMHPNPHRNLVVTWRDLTIVDIGTLFAVQLSDDGALRVTVQEGEVRLSEPSLRPTILSKDEQIVVGGPDHPGRAAKKRVTAQQVDSLLSWRTGVLTIHCGSVAGVAQQLNRYNLTQIEVSDPVIARQPVAGAFAVDDPRGFARAIVALYPGLEVQESRATVGTKVLRLRRQPGAWVDIYPFDCDPNR